ncbi:MAG: hypothetical protein KF760_32755 [Candidatus Eremiobacteraeota bacterium]|nr:hypothetical protein [Candidatus Eremiobacteraeota bacterium]MCW5868555.1 hypothetical protein [Candidatus Eremiobacteraeota bacterium]
MESELAWPEASDLLPGRPLCFYALRSLFAGTAGAAVAQAGLPWGILAGLLVFTLSPSWRRIGQAPEWVAENSYRERVPERSQKVQLALLVLLTLLCWNWSAVLLVALSLPFLCYRVFSQLWTELDLESGQVWHHRTFLGQQLTRFGTDLSRAQAVVSGLKQAKAGEEVSYSVSLWLGDGGFVRVQSGISGIEPSHRDGRRLAHKLDLPHYAVPSGGRFTNTYPENHWPALADSEPSWSRPVLPWEEN